MKCSANMKTTLFRALFVYLSYKLCYLGRTNISPKLHKATYRSEYHIIGEALTNWISFASTEKKPEWWETKKKKKSYGNGYVGRVLQHSKDCFVRKSLEYRIWNNWKLWGNRFLLSTRKKVLTELSKRISKMI